MSTNSLIRVEGAAWSVASDVTKDIRRLKTSEGIVKKLSLDYTVSPHHLKTDIDEPVPDFWAIYRDDTEQYLGAVKSANPVLIQNVDTFANIEPLIKEEILRPTIVDTYAGGRQIFGTFEVKETFDILGDTFTNYMIVVNDHMKPNGNLKVISTPLRMACMNAMSSALTRSNMVFTIPGIVDESMLPHISETILNAHKNAVENMAATANNMVDIKINQNVINKIMDELFPYLDDDLESTSHARANATVERQREAFVACMNADNLQNFKGTMYQVFNALTDYSQHVFSSEKGFDLQHRMTILPGINPEATTDSLKVSKFLKNMKSYAKAA